MPYINYDTNGNITGQFANQQYEEQLYFDIPNDGKIYKILNNKLVEDSVAEKSELVQSAMAIRDSKYNDLTNSVLLDQLAITNLGIKLADNEITQAQYDAQKTIYNNRINAKAVLFEAAKQEFYTTTNLPQHTITV